MARPVDPDSGFRVKIHDNGGHRYASTQPAFTDPVTGRKKYRRLHWGVVDENNKFHPDKNYLLAGCMVISGCSKRLQIRLASGMI